MGDIGDHGIIPYLIFQDYEHKNIQSAALNNL